MNPRRGALADPAEVERRRAMRETVHMAPLAAFCAALRDGDAMVPDLDPLDGGTKARVLILMEKPGPKVARTGFVSRDNDDPTAAALRLFAAEAGLDRSKTAIWNVIPRWNGTTRITAAEARVGLTRLDEFLDRMPRLRVAILVGRRAERARDMIVARGLSTITSAHPSAQVRAAFPERWVAIPVMWRQAADAL